MLGASVIALRNFTSKPPTASKLTYLFHFQVHKSQRTLLIATDGIELASGGKVLIVQ
jgi:hypothetical protein